MAELLVFLGVFQSYGILGTVLGSLAVVGAALTAIYILRLLSKVFFGPPPAMWESQTDSGSRELLAAGILVAIIFSVGLWPFPYIEVIESGVNPILAMLPGAR